MLLSFAYLAFSAVFGLVRVALARRAPRCPCRLGRPVCEKGFTGDLNRLQAGAVLPGDEDPGGGEEHVRAAVRPGRTLTKLSREEMLARAVGTGEPDAVVVRGCASVGLVGDRVPVR